MENIEVIGINLVKLGRKFVCNSVKLIFRTIIMMIIMAQKFFFLEKSVIKWGLLPLTLKDNHSKALN